MPINEIEYHPYLDDQVNIFNTSFSQYCKLIVGTFPIYALTDSQPMEDIGIQKKHDWENEAIIQFFYGSRRNRFWRLFSAVFNDVPPNNKEDAISLLNRNDFLITDVIASAFRSEYSPADTSLILSTLNYDIINILEKCSNIKVIYFTSKNAKRHFYEIFNINVNAVINDLDHIETIHNNEYRLITLIPPGGNPRRAPDYFHIFPLLEEEQSLRLNGGRYALAYQERYYRHYLTIPYI